MINYYECMECERKFHHSIAYVIESVNFRIYECPSCGSRLTKPIVEKGKGQDDTRVAREAN